MNKRQKIIVSITGIFLVLLILIGLTYAYFLTRIEGNTNTKSISVTTADLKLVYRDGNGILSPTKAIQPDNTKSIGTKTFTVTNEGNKTVKNYVVTLEDITVTYANDGTTIDGNSVAKGEETTFDRPQDLIYTLSCKSINTTTGLESGKCNGVKEIQFPNPTNRVAIVMNNINVGYRHEYELTISYIDPGVDQSSDMNKTFSALVNIQDMRNSYSDNVNTLAYKVVNNSLLGTTGTNFTKTHSGNISMNSENSTETDYRLLVIDEVANERIYYSNSEEDALNCYTALIEGNVEYDDDYYLSCNNVQLATTCEEIKEKYVFPEYYSFEGVQYVNDCIVNTPIITSKAERILSTDEDDYGISYYYKGLVSDNYVNFANMCWRIVRIQGDGSIKLILEDKDNLCDDTNMNGNFDIGDGYYGYDYEYDEEYYVNYYFVNYLNPTEGGMANAFKSFQTTLAKGIDSTLSNPTTEQIETTLSSKLKYGDWCYDDIAYDTDGNLLENDMSNYYRYAEFYYDSWARLYNGFGTGNTTDETLSCNGTMFTKYSDNTNMYVGTITADEFVHSGGSIYYPDLNAYLINEYHLLNKKNWWTLSPARYGSDDIVGLKDYIIVANEFGSLSDHTVDSSSDNLYGTTSFRPAIILKSDITVTGSGTKADPYEVS